MEPGKRPVETSGDELTSNPEQSYTSRKSHTQDHPMAGLADLPTLLEEIVAHPLSLSK
jgi:hypothetical protein